MTHTASIVMASPVDHGVPILRSTGVYLFAGRDLHGRECLFGVAEQQRAPLLMRIDPGVGVVRQYSASDSLAGGRVSYWSDRWQSVFVFVSRRKSFVALLQLDSRTDELREIELPGAHEHPISIAEAPDGTIYLGCFGKAGLISYQPDTGVAVDLGAMDDVDQYFYVFAGGDGTIAGLVKVTRPHLVVFDPITREHKAVGPIVDPESGVKMPELFRGADGLLYFDSHLGVCRVRGMDLEPVAARPASPGPATLGDGSTFRFIDGARNGLRYQKVALTSPQGARRILTLDYQPNGAHIYLVRPGIDGRIYGASTLPLQHFTFDPKTGKTTDLGASCTTSGQTYSMDWMNGKLYFAAYTHGLLGVYDPTRPYTFPQDEDQFAKVAHTDLPIDHPRWPLRFGDPGLTNPMQLGRMDNVAYRPRDMVAGPAGKVWVVSVPDYGFWGGSLSWYDPKTDAFGGAHRHIDPDCSPVSMTYLPDRKLLAIGFTIYGGSGTTPRAKYAGLALWDPFEDKLVWRGDLGLNSIGFMDLEFAGDGLVYAISHPWPDHVLTSELCLLDLPNQRIVARTRLDTAAGWPVEVSFQRDEQYLYGATRSSIFRVRLGTVDIEVLWRDDGNGPTDGGALLDGIYYFGSHDRLRSLKVRP